MKKILAVISAALVMMISGCSMALSEDQYYDRFRENYSAYIKRVTSISMKLMEIEYGSGECDWEELDADLKTARDSLDAIEKLSPPPIYSVQHQNLCEEMKAEKVWCDAVAKVAEDKEMNDDNLKGVTDAGNASNFNSVAIRLITQMRRDGVGTE